METPLTSLSAAQLRRAVGIKERIEALEQELAGLAGGSVSASAGEPVKRRKLSRAAIARIRAAQKARWAAVRKARGKGSAPARKRRRMSPAARARLASIARARWAKVKAQGKKAL